MDPHAVLGLAPGASPEDVQRAYRALAKRFHPDRAGEAAGELMISINAAYDLLREQLSGDAEAAMGPGRPQGVRNGRDGDPAPAHRVVAGAWLPARVRRVLARELLRELEPGEEVDEVVLTATSDSHDVQLAVTDRRLLWLRDDAIMGRVRYVRYGDVRDVRVRPGGRFRRSGELRVETVAGRRLRFSELRPEVLDRVAAAVSARSAR